MERRADELENENGITYIYLLGDVYHDMRPQGVFVTLETAQRQAHKHNPEVTWERDETFDIWRCIPHNSGWTIYRRPILGLPFVNE